MPKGEDQSTSKALSDKINNYQKQLNDIVLTPASSSSIITTINRNHAIKRRPTDTPLYTTKTPATKKQNNKNNNNNNINTTSAETEAMSLSPDSPLSPPRPRERERSTQLEVIDQRRRSMSPPTPSNSRLARLGATTVQKTKTSLVSNKDINENKLITELLHRLTEIEKRSSTTEVRLYDNEQKLLHHEQELTHIRDLIEENKNLKLELETAHAKIAKLKAQQLAHHNPIEITNTNMDLEEVNHTKAQTEKEKKLQKQLYKLDQQNQRHQHATSAKHQSQQQEASSSTAKTPSYAKITGKNVAPKKKKISPPTEKMLNWAQRILQPATENTGYTVVYMPSPRRTLHSEIRRALRLLNVAQERVIDIHFPAHGVVGLLIHSSYEKELRELLIQAKLKPKDDFDPTVAITVGDPTLLSKLSETERAT
ncbi:hypothetical protein BDC45DRAFT_571745 [Circinella umbellata]|nr:hypothetical protein BDC45DRAFT_571745 [Circinella umbellata]